MRRRMLAAAVVVAVAPTTIALATDGGAAVQPLRAGTIHSAAVYTPRAAVRVQQPADPPSARLLDTYIGKWWTVREDTRFSPGTDLRRSDPSASASLYRQSIRNLDDEIATEAALDQPVASSQPAVSVASAAQTSAPVVDASGLMACIIRNESGGNPQAVNGQYAGIGQWNANSWAQYGGTQYASSPTGASYQQQLNVLAAEGPAGMVQQQAQYDGC